MRDEIRLAEMVSLFFMCKNLHKTIFIMYNGVEGGDNYERF